MLDFVESQANALIAHRLRRASDRIVDEIGAILPKLHIDVPPRGASMMLLIDDEAPIGVVEVARRLRQSHPLMVRMAQRFETLGLVTIKSDPADARRRLLVPSAKGRRQAKAIREFNIRLNVMFEALFAEIDCPLAAALGRLDAALDAVSIAERISATAKI